MDQDKSRFYVVQHLRGDLPLWVSFWVNTILINSLYAILVYQLTEKIFYRGKTPDMILLGALILAIPLTVVQGTGVRMSAQRYIAGGGSVLMAKGARIVTMAMIWATSFIAARWLFGFLF